MADDRGGANLWTRHVLRRPPILGGREMDPVSEWSRAHPGTAPGIRMGDGGVVLQTVLGHRLAARGARAETLDFSIQNATFDDWVHLEELRTRPTAFAAYFELPRVDIFRLSPDDPVRTLFFLSRPLPYDDPASGLSFSALPATVRLEDVPGKPEAVPDVPPTVLTRIDSGTPGPDEVLIPDGFVEVIETADVSPDAPWRQLYVEANRWTYVMISNLEQTESGGGFTTSLSLQEVLLPKEFEAT